MLSVQCTDSERESSRVSPLLSPLLQFHCLSPTEESRAFEMAPAKKDDREMKQKNLMSFFGNKGDTKSTPAGKSKPAATPKVAKTTKADPSSSPVKDVHTPLPKANSQSSGIASATYTRSSDGGRSAFETPPTSDPIDVDMLSEVDPLEALQSSSVKSVSASSPA